MLDIHIIANILGYDNCRPYLGLTPDVIKGTYLELLPTEILNLINKEEFSVRRFVSYEDNAESVNRYVKQFDAVLLKIEVSNFAHYYYADEYTKFDNINYIFAVKDAIDYFEIKLQIGANSCCDLRITTGGDDILYISTKGYRGHYVKHIDIMPLFKTTNVIASDKQRLEFLDMIIGKN